jgi:beta-xylosidase
MSWRRSFSLLVALLLVAPTVHAQQPDTYANPLDVQLADPYVIKHDGTYYLYGTENADDGFMAWSSRDLVNWRDHGFIYDDRRPGGWARRAFWAPEMFQHNGRFYLHGSAKGRTGVHRLFVVEGDSPLGPFKDKHVPWFDDAAGGVIDGHIFKDTDGKLYLYYVLDCTEDRCGEIQVRPLNDDLSVAGEPTFCIKPSQSWEGDRWNEGPYVLKRGDTYVLMYSANGYMDPFYSVGFATSKSPLGPWKKSNQNPILKRNDDVYGTGHHSITSSPDGSETFIVYHAHQWRTSDPLGNSRRHLAIDRMTMTDGPDGPRFAVHGPTHAPQPMPAGAPPLVRGQDDEFDATTISRERWTIFQENPGTWRLANGRLLITMEDGDIHEERNDLHNLLLQYAPHGDFDVTTRVRVEPKRNYEQAYLTVWQDQHNFVKLSVIYDDGKVGAEVAVERDVKNVNRTNDVPLGPDMSLRISKRGDTYRFATSVDEKQWTNVGEPIEVKLIDLRIGIGATSPESNAGSPAAFDYVRFDVPPR